MAIYYARKTGNVNATDVWATTPSGTASNVFSSFTNQDILMANGFTVTLNVNTTVLEVRNDASNSATAGGSFTLSGGVTLNANIYGSSALSYSGPTASTINGSVQTTAATTLVMSMSGGTLYINGVLGPSMHTNAECLRTTGGTLIFTGTVYGGNGAGTGSCGIRQYGLGTVIVNGSITAMSNSGGNSIVLDGSGPVTVNGTITGGTIYHSSASLLTVNGVAGGGNLAPAISMISANGSCVVTRAKGNGFGPGSVGMTSQVGIASNQTSSAKVYEIEYGPLGQSPTSGPVELIGANSNVAVFATRFGNPKTLVDLNNSVNLVPTSGNVRSGVAYNYGNDTGSCVVPHPNSVVYGVPVDNTAGSGLLSPVAVWNALTNAIGTSGSIAERLKNCSTVATVGKQLEGVL